MNVNKLHYSIYLQGSDEDQVYIATVPELPGCKTHGKTYKKALKNARQVIEIWAEDARTHREILPPPQILALASIKTLG